MKQDAILFPPLFKAGEVKLLVLDLSCVNSDRAILQRPCTLHVISALKPKPHPLEPANYVSIIRGFQPIHESLTIDPSLDVPLAQRPPRTQTEPTEAKRNNVNLKVHNAEIVADIHVVEPKVGETTAPAKVYVRSDVGDISIRMVRLLHPAPILPI